MRCRFLYFTGSRRVILRKGTFRQERYHDATYIISQRLSRIRMPHSCLLLPYVTIKQRVYIIPHRLARYIPVNTYDADSHDHFILIPPYAQYCTVEARINVPWIESPYDSPVRGCFSKYLIDTRFTYISVFACIESRQGLLLSGPATSDLIAYERIVTGSESFYNSREWPRRPSTSAVGVLSRTMSFTLFETSAERKYLIRAVRE